MNILNASRHRNSSGFTLVELLIAMAAMSIIMAVIGSVLVGFQRGHTEQQVTTDAVQKGRSALELMSEEIKLAGLDPEGSLNFNIVTATPTVLTFDFDVPDTDPTVRPRFDGKVNLNSTKPAERLTFGFGSQRLERLENLGLATSPSSPPAAEVLLTGVNTTGTTASRFVYLNSAGAVTTIINDIRSIRIDLTITESAGGNRTISRTLNSRVYLRNMAFNDQRRAN